MYWTCSFCSIVLIFLKICSPTRNMEGKILSVMNKIEINNLNFSSFLDDMSVWLSNLKFISRSGIFNWKFLFKLVCLALSCVPEKSLSTNSKWPSIPLRRAYRACVFLFQFCLPLLITVFLYFRIYFILKRRSFKKLQNSHRHRTNKALMTIVLLFTICWLPWNIFVLLDEFDYEVVRGKFFKLTDLLLKILAISSACINPILYAWLNDNFQKELDHIVGNSSSKDEDCLPTKEGHTLLQPSPSATQTSSTYSENSTTNFCWYHTIFKWCPVSS